MEPYIKGDISDITYMSELTPHPDTEYIRYNVSGCGVNSQTAFGLRLTSLSLRKSSAH
jgi:hypothetical protein